jgi:tryptophan synthase beta chain
MESLGFFGPFGGCYAPESLMPALEELETAFNQAMGDVSFVAQLDELLAHYAGRPTPLYHAKRWSQALGGAQVWLKREDLLHGGAHKTNNAIGQALLAQRMGKTRLIAETGAGQHGVATAMAGALLGLETHIYMGAVDMQRQAPNVLRMELLGAHLHAVTTGGQTLKDAVNEAMRDWISNVRSTHYILGTAAGPHPFPTMVKRFHQVIGQEARRQVLHQAGKLPHSVLACVGGGSNAIGIFSGFMEDDDVRLVGVEPAGHGIDTDFHGAVLAKGSTGIFQGMRSKVLQTNDGQILNTHSISAGVDYPSVGPEHVYLQSTGRARYVYASDDEVLHAFGELARYEGILPALESSHALAHAIQLAPTLTAEDVVLINLSGRGDKDLETVKSALAERAAHPKEAHHA